jgi:hypothetical protein
MERFDGLGGFGGVVGSQPGILDGRANSRRGRAPRPFDRAARIVQAFVALVLVILVGGMIGRGVYQVVERPRTVVVSTCGSAKPGDVLEMWAYPYGKVLASPTRTRVVAGGTEGPHSPWPVATFEVNAHTPDFQIVDTTATLYSRPHSYADVVAAAPHALAINLCERELRMLPGI